MPQRVRRRLRHAGRPRGAPERSARAAARAVRALAAARRRGSPTTCTPPPTTRSPSPPGTPASPSAGAPRRAAPPPQILGQRREQPHAAALPGLARIDRQRSLADVLPAQVERLARPQPRVGEHRDQRRVPQPARGAHRLDRRRRQRPHLAPRRPRRPCAPSAPDCARSARTPAPAAGSRPSSDIALSTAVRPAPAAIRSACQRATSSGVSSDSLNGPRYGADVQVVEQRVGLRRPRRQRHRVRARPRLRHVLIERLARPDQDPEIAEPAPPAQLVLERHRVRLAIKRPRTRRRPTAAVTPAHPPAHRPVRPLHAMQAHGRARSPIAVANASPSTRRAASRRDAGAAEPRHAGSDRSRPRRRLPARAASARRPRGAAADACPRSPPPQAAPDWIARRTVSGCTPATCAACATVSSGASPAARRSASRFSTRSASRSIVAARAHPTRAHPASPSPARGSPRSRRARRSRSCRLILERQLPLRRPTPPRPRSSGTGPRRPRVPPARNPSRAVPRSTSALAQPSRFADLLRRQIRLAARSPTHPYLPSLDRPCASCRPRGGAQLLARDAGAPRAARWRRSRPATRHRASGSRSPRTPTAAARRSRRRSSAGPTGRAARRRAAGAAGARGAPGAARVNVVE